MIIYGEDRVATGVTAVDMREGAKDVVEQARTRIVIEEARKS